MSKDMPVKTGWTDGLGVGMMHEVNEEEGWTGMNSRGIGKDLRRSFSTAEHYGFHSLAKRILVVCQWDTHGCPQSRMKIIVFPWNGRFGSTAVYEKTIRPQPRCVSTLALTPAARHQKLDSTTWARILLLIDSKKGGSTTWIWGLLRQVAKLVGICSSNIPSGNLT